MQQKRGAPFHAESRGMQSGSSKSCGQLLIRLSASLRCTMNSEIRKLSGNHYRIGYSGKAEPEIVIHIQVLIEV